MHSSGVVLDGGAIVIIGDSGAGKSTLAARMAAAGGHLLSDDTVFAVEDTGQVVGMADRSRLVEVVPRVPPANGQDPDGKFTVPARSVTTGPAEPRLLLFLDPVSEPEIRCRPVRPAEVMARLLRNGVMHLDPASGGPRLRALARLADACPAYTVTRGPEPPSGGMLEQWMEMARK